MDETQADSVGFCNTAINACPNVVRTRRFMPLTSSFVSRNPREGGVREGWSFGEQYGRCRRLASCTELRRAWATQLYMLVSSPHPEKKRARFFVDRGLSVPVAWVVETIFGMPLFASLNRAH